ncbi:MAG TPA: hypothetical protein VNA14_13435 [Mycobacteriales bacterium]|nr:hypothetical protein [Mycobacteriales bacterium]
MSDPTCGRRRAVALVVAVAVAALAACSGGPGSKAEPSTVVAPSLDALSDAIELVNQGRATALDRARKLTSGLERRDAVDALATTGARSAAGQADPGADEAMTQAVRALDDLGPALEAYQRGIDDLGRAAASPELTTEQRRPLGTVIATARVEISATRALASAVRAGLPSYAALGGHLDEWLRRARAGWYRNEGEAANAYAVLVGDTRARLEQVRSAVSDADAARTTAGNRTTDALRLARAALEPLTTRPTEVVLSPSELAG